MAYATTSKGRESTSSTVSRAKKMLSSSLKKTGGSVKKGDTSKSRLAEIASQDFVTDKNRKDLVSSGAITSADMKDVGQIPLPQGETTVAGDVSANNVGFTGGDTGMTSVNGVLTPAPQTEDKYAGATAIYDKYVSDITQAGEDRTTGADIQRQLEKDTQIKKLRQTENDLSAQINTIIANRDAAKLGLEGQGRGISETIIGGQQARLDKDAAIRALPIQALLAQAQGNVALAEAHINTWGSILMSDANNEYNQRKELLTGAKDFAIGIEGKRIDDLNTENERKYQEKQALITAKTQALANAMGQEAPQSVVAAIQAATTAEEVVAATGKYNTNVLDRQIKQKQLQDLYSPTTSGTDSGWKLKDVNGVASWVNEDTQEVRPVDAANPADQKKVDQALGLKGLLNQMVQHPGFNLSVGSPISRVASLTEGGLAGQAFNYLSGNREGFNKIFDQVVEGITVDQLGKMSGPKTDKDIEILRNAAVRLSKSTSEQEFLGVVKEMQTSLDRVVNELGTTPEQTSFYYGVDPQLVDEASLFYDNAGGSLGDATFPSYLSPTSLFTNSVAY